MARQHGSEHGTPTAEQDAGAFDMSDRPFHVGESYPDVMRVPDMLRAFRIRKSRFYLLAAEGAFDRFEIKHHPTGRAWSGALVVRHLREAGHTSLFGRKSLRHAG
jgi:hypothetical protein